jgi:hypothetical protein
MTFLECCHSSMWCPGARGPRRRLGVVALERWDGPGRGSARRHEGDAQAGPCTQPRGRVPRRFRKRVAVPASGGLRREAPVSQARRGAVMAADARRNGRDVRRGNEDVADPDRAQIPEPDRRGARGAADTKSMQVGLTVNGRYGARQHASCARCCAASIEVRGGSRGRLAPSRRVPAGPGQGALTASKPRDRRRAPRRERPRIDDMHRARRRGRPLRIRDRSTASARHVASIQESLWAALPRGHVADGRRIGTRVREASSERLQAEGRGQHLRDGGCRGAGAGAPSQPSRCIAL